MGYKFINQTIIDGDVINISVIVIELKYGDIDADDFTCHGYYIIKFSSSIYTPQADVSIDGQFISYYKMVREGTYCFL